LKTILVSAAVIIEGGKVLVTQREEGDSHGLFWEFPGGKIEDGEDPRRALQRELREELGIEVKVEKIWDVVFHVYPEYPVLLLFYLCRIEKGVPRPIGCRALRWVDGRELPEIPLLPADVPLIEGLREKLDAP
jgi:8-oxo-dGTP diphosphatase